MTLSQPLLFLFLLLSISTGFQLRHSQTASGPSGPAAPAALEAAPSGPSGNAAEAVPPAASSFALTLLKLADQMEGSKDSSATSDHQKFAQAVIKSAHVVSAHHLQQVVEALSKFKKAKSAKAKQPQKIPVAEIVNALR